MFLRVCVAFRFRYRKVWGFKSLLVHRREFAQALPLADSVGYRFLLGTSV
jgi:hypothetical protein